MDTKKTAIRNRKPILRVLRRVVQLAAFLLFPGLFIMLFSALKAVFIALIGGTFRFSDLSGELLLLLAVLPVTALMGRFFCGFLCAFGSMGDFFWFLSPKRLKQKIRISESADRVLKGIKYVLLAAIVVLVWTLGSVSFDSTANPWTIFGIYSTLSGWSSLAYLLSAGGILLLLILIGSMLVERFFCRYLCPLGAIFVPLSRLRAFRIKKPKQDCGACKLCSRKCPMGIPLYRADTVSSGECIDCFACVETCPRGNVGTSPAPAVAVAATVLVIAGLTWAGTLTEQEKQVNTEHSTGLAITSGMPCGPYADGIYTGSAPGYKGTTTVQVTVENGYLADIEVISTDDDRAFFIRAESSVIPGILSQQSTEVDTVTGATFSSDAIIEAVVNALSSGAVCDSENGMMNSPPEADAEPAGEETEPNDFDADVKAEDDGSSAEQIPRGGGRGRRG